MKWRTPCALCNGQGRYKCVICGWKRKSGTNKKAPTLMEQAEKTGKEERINFLGRAANGMLKFNIDTVGDAPEDNLFGAPTDHEIEAHLVWERDIYERHQNGVKLERISKDEGISLGTVKGVIERMKRREYLENRC